MDDPTTEQIDGFFEGNEIAFKYVNELLDQPVNLEPVLLLGKEVFSPLETAVFSVSLSPAFHPEDVDKGISFNCYPNPVKHELTISYSVPEGLLRIEIFDINGNLVDQIYSGQKEAGFYQTIYPTDKLRKGLYVIKFHHDYQRNAQAIVTKFLKQ